MTDELWQVRGSTPVLWTVPFRVVWRGAEAELFCALPLLQKQQKAVDELLAGVARPCNGAWMIARPALKRIAQIMPPGTDSEACFSWERPRRAMEPEFKPEKRAERDRFLDSLYQQGVGRSRDELEFLWNQFCVHALDWLINQERPVDMYFVRLQPSPYRPDWIHRVSEISRKGRSVKRFAADPIKLLHNPEFLERLKRPNLLSFDAERGICERRIEVEHTATWWRNVRHIEQERLTMLEPTGYAQMVLDSVADRVPASIVAYASHKRGSQGRTCRLRRGQLAGTFQFVPVGRPSKVAKGQPA